MIRWRWIIESKSGDGDGDVEDGVVCENDVMSCLEGVEECRMVFGGKGEDD